jgi:hypothetical protein
MPRRQILLLLLALAVACGAGVATSLAVGADSAAGSLPRDRVHTERSLAASSEPADVEPRPKGGQVVCPGIIFKVGPTVTLPCRRGAEIVKARLVAVGGRYCARVTYIAQRGSAPRTETLCVGDVPSVGGKVE